MQFFRKTASAATFTATFAALVLSSLQSAHAQTAPSPAVVAAPVAPVPPVSAQAAALRIKALAATCANCHGTNGKAPEGAAVLGLAGVPKDYIVAQMNAFKSGARPATIMHQLSKGYSDAQIDAIATYFAAQKK
jgi:cytochrome subunit of sulfide dehydrogenase